MEWDFRTNVKLTNPALVGNDVTTIIIHGALCNVVPKIRFRHLVPRVQMHSKVECSMHEVRNIHPLTVNIVVINVVTPGRYPLITHVSTVPDLLESRIALGVLQTETRLMSLGDLFAGSLT